MKVNVRHQKRSPLKNIYLYILYLAVPKSLNTYGGVIFTLSFPDNINFPEKLLF